MQPRDCVRQMRYRGGSEPRRPVQELGPTLRGRIQLELDADSGDRSDEITSGFVVCEALHRVERLVDARA